jgi:hypothetical protein
VSDATDPQEDRGMDQAKAACERARKALEEVVAQRPEVTEVVAKSIQLRKDNHFSELWVAAARKVS